MSTVVRRSAPMTRQGYERLQAELERLVTHERREMAAWLREAKNGGGEPGENPEVAAALAQQAELERRISDLQATLALASIAEPVDGVAGVGQVVRLRVAGSAVPFEYHLVSPAESDPRHGRISVESPVGEALVGRRAGDVVEVTTPGGARTMEIVAVVSPEEAR
jgi:transcription elongation factor GreA